MCTGSHASQHWGAGVQSDDGGITLAMARVVLQSTRCGCWWLPVGTSAGTGLPVSWFTATNPHSHWLEELQAKALMALTWEVLHLNSWVLKCTVVVTVHTCDYRGSDTIYLLRTVIVHIWDGSMLIQQNSTSTKSIYFDFKLWNKMKWKHIHGNLDIVCDV